MNIFGLLSQTARRYPRHGAIYRGTEQILDFAGLEDRALRLGGALAASAAPGERILIASKNCPEYVELLFGAWAAGLVVVPVNAKLHVKEIAQIVEDSQPRWLFLSSGLASEWAAEGLDAAAVTRIGGDDYTQLVETAPIVPVERCSDDLAWLFFTSGTTGRAKGAMLSHRNLQAMAIAHLADFDSADASTSLIHAAPMSHGSGLYILPYVARGARQVVPASYGYDAAEFLALCEAHPRAAAFLAPTMVRRLTDEVERRGEVPDGLNLIIYGGGPMYLADIHAALKALGQRLAQLYGQGEAPMTIAGLPRAAHDGADDALLASVGWARSGVEIRVADDEGRAVTPGEPGEILCRGDVVMAGYWNDPAATARALRDGWLYTGDVGTLGDDGCLTLMDRSKDLIISGGTNIYPREIEEVLLTHPDVAEVAVIGEPDPEWGEIVVAVIACVAGRAVEEGELDAYCLAQIARFKRPKRYLFVEALPKNAYGKIAKRDVKAWLACAEAVRSENTDQSVRV